MIVEDIKITDPEDIWEAVQIITGETFIFHKGFREEADIKNVFNFSARYDSNGNIVYKFSRFDFNPATPERDSRLRLNRSVITFAWYIDPSSDVIAKLKSLIVQMDAKRAGLVFPGPQGV
jgi:hypothetical protein